MFRLTWLINIANKHTERENFMEAAHCFLHCSALVIEYLSMLQSGSLRDTLFEYLPHCAQDFEEFSSNIHEESVLSDDIIK